MSNQLVLSVCEWAGSAVFSEDRRYRYRLERRLRDGQTLALVGLNPSDADETTNDHTVKKLIGFSERIGVTRFIVTNIAAYVSTEPLGLRLAVDSGTDPIGPENDQHIIEAAREADIVVPMWGAGISNLRGAYAARPDEVLGLLRSDGHGPKLRCWGWTGKGHPRHPLMIPYATQLEKVV